MVGGMYTGETPTFERYGFLWDEGESDLTVELMAFKMGLSVGEGGLGKAEHFWNVVDMLWGNTPMAFYRHPWADRMLNESCVWDYLAVAGCASSGKTRFFAVYAIVNYLADPENTLVLITSTSLKDSRRRIWGDVELLWNSLPAGVRAVGRLVTSTGVIKYVGLDDEGKEYVSERSGLALLAGEEKEAKDTVRKMIGFKQERVFLLADELPELSESILMAALGNLTSNPYFQLIGIGNPKSYYDPFGRFACPTDGYASISDTDEEWFTAYGKCIRFDGLKSPNVVAGREVYAGLLTLEKVEKIRKNLGEHTPQFWRMVRGYWCPSGQEATIYSDAELLMNGAEDRVQWATTPLRLGGMDASFSEDGDRAIAWFASLGTSVDGVLVLQFDEEGYELTEDVREKSVSRDFQIARQFRDLCNSQGVRVNQAGVDSTGAGGPFCSILASEWEPGFSRVYFGGAASDRPVSISDPRKGNEAYTNRVTEIWFAGKELLRTGQLKGVPVTGAKEMVARKYSTVKRGSGMAVEAEPKKKMKQRIGFSPDISDTLFIIIDVAREKFGLVSKDSEVQAQKQMAAFYVPDAGESMMSGINLKRVQANPPPSAPAFDPASVWVDGFDLNLRRHR